jgi:hypothetical protein
MTNLFYDAFKENDPNHLVSISGFDCLDVMHWDPGVMKIDFYRAHMYPYIRENGYDNEAGKQRIESRLYWLAHNCPMPWMIGESGFRAKVVGEPLSAYDGTETEQHDFADFEINRVRDCNASGYSWYGFQPFWTEADKWHKEFSYPDGHHLVRSGTVLSPPNSNLDRPACSTFKYYPLPNPNFSSCTKPDYYYDPYHLNGSPLYEPPLPYSVSGTITENEPEAYPIEDAIVYGNGYYVDLGGHDQPGISYTFTDGDGKFLLNIAPYQNSIFADYNWIKISSIKSETVLLDIIDHLPLSYSTTLNKPNFYYDLNISNRVIHASTNNPNFYGWNSITASNISVAAGVTSEFKARKEINLEASFNCFNGSEVHIHCGNVYADCNNLPRTFNPGFVNSAESGQLSSRKKELQIQILPNNTYPISVIPNPGNGVFTLQTDIVNKTLDPVRVLVFDISGRLVTVKEIPTGDNSFDLSTISKGAYMLKIQCNEKIYSQKLLIY